MKMARYLLAAAVAITVTSSFAFAQFARLPGERIYRYHTAPTYPCPGMDWLLTTGENGSISQNAMWQRWSWQAARSRGLATWASQLDQAPRSVAHRSAKSISFVQ
jgi:hypothetical protein